MRQLLIASVFGIAALALAGCLPTHLEKYQKPRGSQAAGEPVAAAQPNFGNTGGAPKAPVQSPAVKRQPGSGGPIVALSTNTFRFRLPMAQVWDGAIGVLLNNYNINTLDKESGVITTEWDTFYLNEKVFRNKVTMHVKKSAWNAVDVALYNNVEVLQESPNKGPSLWLPAKKGVSEVNRIIKNMAIYLNQPAPVFPDEMMAWAGEAPK